MHKALAAMTSGVDLRCIQRHRMHGEASKSCERHRGGGRNAAEILPWVGIIESAIAGPSATQPASKTSTIDGNVLKAIRPRAPSDSVSSSPPQPLPDFKITYNLQTRLFSAHEFPKNLLTPDPLLIDHLKFSVFKDRLQEDFKYESIGAFRVSFRRGRRIIYKTKERKWRQCL